MSFTALDVILVSGILLSPSGLSLSLDPFLSQGVFLSQDLFLSVGFFLFEDLVFSLRSLRPFVIPYMLRSFSPPVSFSLSGIRLFWVSVLSVQFFLSGIIPIWDPSLQGSVMSGIFLSKILLIWDPSCLGSFIFGILLSRILHVRDLFLFLLSCHLFSTFVVRFLHEFIPLCWVLFIAPGFLLSLKVLCHTQNLFLLFGGPPLFPPLGSVPGPGF
jgi:hypothetical protein